VRRNWRTCSEVFVSPTPRSADAAAAREPWPWTAKVVSPARFLGRRRRAADAIVGRGRESGKSSGEAASRGRKRARREA